MTVWFADNRALSSTAIAIRLRHSSVRRRTDSPSRIRQALCDGIAQTCNCHWNKEVPTQRYQLSERHRVSYAERSQNAGSCLQKASFR